jgi:hypothetical protein
MDRVCGHAASQHAPPAVVVVVVVYSVDISANKRDHTHFRY